MSQCRFSCLCCLACLVLASDQLPEPGSKPRLSIFSAWGHDRCLDQDSILEQGVRPRGVGNDSNEQHVRPPGGLAGWERNKEATRRVGVVAGAGTERREEAGEVAAPRQIPETAACSPGKTPGVQIPRSSTAINNFRTESTFQKKKFERSRGPPGRIGRPPARHEGHASLSSSVF